MPLKEKHDKITWSESHYLFIEKRGNFMETAPKAWTEFNQRRSEILVGETPKAFASLYQIKPEMIYRAGVFLSKKPEIIPAGFSYESFEGGPYLRFVLTGSYSQLPEACGKVFEIVRTLNVPMRNSFFIENYVNDPQTTPEAELITEILIPTT